MISPLAFRRFVTIAVFAIGIVGFIALVFGLGDDNRLIQAFDVRVVLPDHMSVYRQSISDGRLPLWNPHVYSGTPFMANPATQVFYPTSLLFLWLAPWLALTIQFFLHLVVAAVGTYLLARISYGTSAGAAIIAALIYALSGRVVGHAFAGHYGLVMALAYIPLIAFVADRGVNRLALTTSTRSLPGFWHGLVSRLRDTGPWPWVGGMLLALQILTGGLPMVWLGLLSIGLLRVIYIVANEPLDWRTWAREALILGSITVTGVMLAALQLIPSFELASLSDRPRDFAYAAAGSFNPRFFLLMLHPRAVLSGKTFYWEFYGYLGLLPLALAAVGLTGFRTDKRIPGLIIVGIIISLYMLGKYSFVFPLLWKYVPTFDMFRIPARAMVIVSLVIALLAAIGVDRIIEWVRGKSRFASRLSPALVTAICIVTWLDIVKTAQWYERWLFTPVTADLVTDADTSSPALVASRARHAKTLATDPTWYRYWFDAHNLRRNYAYEIGGHHIGGYDVMTMQRYSRFLHYMTDNGYNTNFSFVDPIFFNSPSPYPFKILGLKYVDNAGKLWEKRNPGEILRAWFVTDTVIVEDEPATLEYIRSSAFRPHMEVVFERADAAWLNPRPDSPNQKTSGSSKEPDATRVPVTVREKIPEELILDVPPHEAGIIVLSEIFYPGWQADIDGRPLPVHRCNSILRCLKLEQSQSPTRIRMIYQPATLRWGIAISFTTLLIVVPLVWIGRRRFRIESAQDIGPQGF